MEINRINNKLTLPFNDLELLLSKYDSIMKSLVIKRINIKRVLPIILGTELKLSINELV